MPDTLKSYENCQNSFFFSMLTVFMMKLLCVHVFVWAGMEGVVGVNIGNVKEEKKNLALLEGRSH